MWKSFPFGAAFTRARKKGHSAVEGKTLEYSAVRATAKAPYSVLARYYDRLFTPHGRFFRRARRRVLQKVLQRARAVCDLACGTGTTGLEFARRGLRVFAVDASPVMCRLAHRKARRSRLPVRVMRADMRTFHLPETVDLVTCEFDAINHVPRRADFERAARAVNRALRPGGYFYFDVNTRRAFEEVWPSTWFVETQDFVLVGHGGYDRRGRKGWTLFEWFLPKGKHWRRYTERYRQVCWSDKQIRRALRKAGFSRIRSWDSIALMSGLMSIRPGCRIFYLAQKPRSSKV